MGLDDRMCAKREEKFELRVSKCCQGSRMWGAIDVNANFASKQATVHVRAESLEQGGLERRLGRRKELSPESADQDRPSLGASFSMSLTTHSNADALGRQLKGILTIIRVMRWPCPYLNV
jgi:hypothetical protein